MEVRVQAALINHETMMIVDPATGHPIVKIIEGQIISPLASE